MFLKKKHSFKPKMFFDLSKTLEKKNFIREDLKKYDNWKPWKNITRSRSRVAKYEKTNKQTKKKLMIIYYKFLITFKKFK